MPIDFVSLCKFLNMQQMDEIKITKAPTSKLPSVDFNNLGFGNFFTDHMLVVDYRDGEWGNAEIVPYGPISFEPALSAIHYGQSIFEGIKAYRMKDGSAAIYRPYENMKRFNRSALRMEMPEVPEELFIGGIKKLLQVEDQWIPNEIEHALYVRPFMFSTDQVMRVMPATTYKFMIILSPVGAYYAAPMRLWVEQEFVRAAAGGVGNAKTAGNYAASLHPFAVAKKRGYDQVLWTDANEHKYVQECGTMNVFFLVGGKLLTPGLDSGTILEGVTRDSVIQVAGDLGIAVEERDISIDELVQAYQAGQFTEAFGSGTAATVAKIEEINYKDFIMTFNPLNQPVADALKQRLTEIRDGVLPDTRGWMVKADS
jgi:branched-chain amino acid aminotransferase